MECTIHNCKEDKRIKADIGSGVPSNSKENNIWRIGKEAEMSRHRQSEQQSRRDGDNKGVDQKHRSEQRRNQNIVQRLVNKDSLHSQTRQWQVGADQD